MFLKNLKLSRSKATSWSIFYSVMFEGYLATCHHPGGAATHLIVFCAFAFAATLELKHRLLSETSIDD